MSRQIWVLSSFIFIAVATYLFWNKENIFSSDNNTPLVTSAKQSNSKTIDNKSPGLSSEEVQLVQDNMRKEYDAYMSNLETGEKVRDLLKNADSLNEHDKALKIGEIQNEISTLKSEEKLSNVEHLMLQLALLKLSPDSEQAKLQSQNLIEEYREITEARNQEFINNPSPQFKDYKSREKEIVAEVMRMEVFPDGLTKEEYLAKRLAEAREQAYQ